MKFMLTWRVHPDKRADVFKAFVQMTPEEDQADSGPKIKVLGRWHDVQKFTGVAIAETDDPQALASWALNWNSAIDLEVSPVLDDDEATGVVRF